MEELWHGGVVAAFRIELGEGEDRFDHEGPLSRRCGFGDRHMEVLTPQAALVASHPEQALQCLHDRRLAGTIYAHKRGQAGRQVDRSGFGTEAAEIGQDQAFDGLDEKAM